MRTLRSLIGSVAVAALFHFALLWLVTIGVFAAWKMAPISLWLVLLYLSSVVFGGVLSMTKGVVMPSIVAPVASMLACIASLFLYNVLTVKREPVTSFVFYILIPVVVFSFFGTLIVQLCRKHRLLSQGPAPANNG